MKHINTKIWYLILFSFSIFYISQNIYPAAAALSGPATSSQDSVHFSTNQSYPPRDWYLKCLCWNTSWSLVEWKRHCNQWLKKNASSYLTEISSNENAYIKTIECDRDKLLFKKLEFTDKLKFTDEVTVPPNTTKFNSLNDLKSSLLNDLKRSFMNKLNALLIHIKNNDYDVICLQESPPGFCDTINQELQKQSPAYAICYNPYDTTTGCCIIYKKSINPDSICTETKRIFNDMNADYRAQQISVKIPKSSRTNIISIHVSKDYTLPFLSALKASINKIMEKVTSDSPYIIMGDFNAPKNSLLGLNTKMSDIAIEDIRPDKSDHCLFDKAQFISSRPNSVNDPVFTNSVDTNSHIPFTIEIMSNNLFIPKEAENLIKVYKKSMAEIITRLRKNLALFEKAKNALAEKDDTEADLFTKNSCLNIIQTIVKPIEEINTTSSDFYTQFINEAEKVIYIEQSTKQLSTTNLTSAEDIQIIHLQDKDLNAFKDKNNVENALLYIRKLNLEYQNMLTAIDQFQQKFKSELKAKKLLGSYTTLKNAQITEDISPEKYKKIPLIKTSFKFHGKKTTINLPKRVIQSAQQKAEQKREAGEKERLKKERKEKQQKLREQKEQKEQKDCNDIINILKTLKPEIDQIINTTTVSIPQKKNVPSAKTPSTTPARVSTVPHPKQLRSDNTFFGMRQPDFSDSSPKPPKNG